MTVPIVAVDGGNSKTDIALLGEDGSLLAALRGPTVSHQQIGPAEAGARLAVLAREAAARAGLASGDAPVARLAVLCLAGMDLPSDRRVLAAAHGGSGLAAHVELHNDTEAALRAGSPERWGVAVILGQGLNAIGVAPSGRTARFAGLGPISGDRGGGGTLGMEALGAAVRATDGRGPRTTLERLVPAAFGLRRPIDVTVALYQERIPMSRLNELAPILVAAAADGDAVARSVLEALADEAAAFAIAAIRRTGLTRRAVPVVLAGGVARGAHPILTALIDERVRAVAPAAICRVLHAPPVVGAALMALDVVAPDDTAARDRARASLTTPALAAAAIDPAAG
jgi:N-acetylglucosamine kinase-like BadF-type ATPase